MQDRYAGDVGDYIKLALLRSVGAGHKLGLAWFKTPNSDNNDGRHTTYLDEGRAGTWSSLDPDLYAQLKALVETDSRSTHALEGLLGMDVLFHSVSLNSLPRSEWFKGLLEVFRHRDLVFVDPDNGIQLPRQQASGPVSPKHVTLDEIRLLYRGGRPVIIYHHQTRFKGGHIAEIEHVGAQLKQAGLGCILALRARSWSPRVFFIVGATRELWARAEVFADRWSPHLTFHQIEGPPDQIGLPPSSPYSERAELAQEAFALRVVAGEYNHLLPNLNFRMRD